MHIMAPCLSKQAVVALHIKQSGRKALIASLLALYLKRRNKSTKKKEFIVVGSMMLSKRERSTVHFIP